MASSSWSGDLLDQVPFLGPVLPDPGVDFQLVHTDDVASALRAGAEGAGKPGRYNLAGQGAMSVTRMSRALGWWSVPLPGAAVAIADSVASKLPGLPAEAAWLTAFRLPVADGHAEGARGARLGPAVGCGIDVEGDDQRRSRRRSPVEENQPEEETQWVSWTR